MENNTNKLSEVEIIKDKSNYLRGTINESLIDEITGALAAEDTNLIKFHGSYQQSDRDQDSERKKKKLEPLFSFMIRVRVPGGIATPQQWLKMNELADGYANSTIKLTTRQAFQLHGVLKRNLKITIKNINGTLMDTIAACGDVNRNVMCNPNPFDSYIHQDIYDDTRAVSDHLTPRTTAYHEIWLDKQLVAGSKPDEEPIYGKTYLPRKFKIAFVIPPYNDVDVFSNDLGFIAIERKEKLIGYNLVVGGGLGMTFGEPQTYPRLGDVIGYLPREKVVQVAEEVVKIQRDNGNRGDRKQARLKYTIDRLGLNWFKEELNRRLGWQLEGPYDYKFISSGDRYGWHKGTNGKWNYTLFVEGGRVKDVNGFKMKTALKEIAAFHEGDFRLTGNQNLVIANVEKGQKDKISSILLENGVLPEEKFSGLRLNSLACVALNTCPLAFAEAERYLPSLIDKIDELLDKYKLGKDEIVIRMTGCPNGCARPYLGEIGFVGRAVGKYNLYLGAGFAGERLNKLYREMVGEEEILALLEPIIKDYSENREKGERFGDFVIRKNYVKATLEGKDFHN